MVITVRTDLYSSAMSYQNVDNNQEDPVTITIQRSSSMQRMEKNKMVKLKWSSDIGSTAMQAPAKKLCSRVATPDEESLSTKMEPRRSLRKEGRRYSNDMEDAVRSKCNICDKRFLLSDLRGHTNSVHFLSFSEYKNFYGLELEESVYHRCGICSASMLLDTDLITSHIKRHNLSLSNYTRRHLTSSVKATKINSEKLSPKEVDKVSSKKKEVKFSEEELMKMDTDQLHEALDRMIEMYS